MKNIEAGQREMRERNRKAERKDAIVESARSSSTDEVSELRALRKRVTALETENAELRMQIASSLKQPGHVQGTSPEEQRREQQHNYFKYSNARRY
jgi:hypothetical protein